MVVCDCIKYSYHGPSAYDYHFEFSTKVIITTPMEMLKIQMQVSGKTGTIIIHGKSSGVGCRKVIGAIHRIVIFLNFLKTCSVTGKTPNEVQHFGVKDTFYPLQV